MTANGQTPWEPEGPVGGFEINSVEAKYIMHDRWGQEWLMLNCDSGAAATALPQDGPGVYPDFFCMAEAGVATPMLALKFSRSGRMAATALEQKGLTQYGFKFFAGFIQQTGVRRVIKKSDGEPAMKSLKDAATKALEGLESIGQESPVGSCQQCGC